MVKTAYVCSNCGYESQKWYGRCPDCLSWNTFQEILVSRGKKEMDKSTLGKLSVEKIFEVKTREVVRTSTGFEEFDRVLGGGIVPGSVVLLSGDPGVGKSTLLLQVALNVSEQKGRSVLYVTGEESSDQVRLRTERLIRIPELKNRDISIISSTNIDQIMDTLEERKPSLVIIDSIQTMETKNFSGFPGSVPQIRYATSRLIAFAKSDKVPVFLVGHVTKEGMVAGPMLLSHMVDSVLYFEGEEFTSTRILRAFKNRFGDASEVGIFVMDEKGLTQIKDATNFFVDSKGESVPGSCIGVIMEGSRCLFVEIQALIVPTSLSFARRVATGLSEKRLELLLAVIQKHLKVPMYKFDVFVNVVGGMKILEPSTDLAIALAILSSYKNKSLPSTAAISELGLLGELRNIARLEKRKSEARKFGFKRILTFQEFRFLNEVVKDML